MAYKKKGLPEEDTIVLCTVKKILHNSIFAVLDEYEELEGMIHISEIAAGRIRNIRDYVKEGKTIVCKILRINLERKHIDLSLRRVSKMQRINKLKEHKQEIKSEKLLEFVGKKLKIKDIYQTAGEEILEKYDNIYEFFQEVLLDEKNALKNLKIDKEILDTLTKTIKEKLKLPEIQLRATLNLHDHSKEGIEHIKKAFKNTNTLIKKKHYKAKFIYLSAPKYSLEIKAPDYKAGESILKEISDNLVKEITNLGGIGEWQKTS